MRQETTVWNPQSHSLLICFKLQGNKLQTGFEIGNNESVLRGEGSQKPGDKIPKEAEHWDNASVFYYDYESNTQLL